VREIGRAVFLRRRTDGDEREIATANGLREVRAELETIRPIALHDLGEVRLEERYFALAKLLELVLVHVHARHVRAGIGKASTSDQTHVSRTNDGYFHGSPA
jgi:hypothetical protein